MSKLTAEQRAEQCAVEIWAPGVIVSADAIRIIAAALAAAETAQADTDERICQEQIAALVENAGRAAAQAQMEADVDRAISSENKIKAAAILVERLASCHYECIAGPLENNVDYKSLVELLSSVTP